MERAKIDTIKGDTHDVLDEAKHRIEAGGEKLNRALQGHDVKADFDRSKRDLRDADGRDGDGI